MEACPAFNLIQRGVGASVRTMLLTCPHCRTLYVVAEYRFLCMSLHVQRLTQAPPLATQQEQTEAVLSTKQRAPPLNRPVVTSS